MSATSTSNGPFHLVICPGAWCQVAQWQGFVEAMNRSPLDLSGITLVQWPNGEEAVGLSGHVDAVLSAVPVGTGPLVMLGHSFGTFPLLEASAVLGERVRGVVLVDGFLPVHGLSAFAQSEGRRGPASMRAAAVSGAVPPPDPMIWGLRDDLAPSVISSMQTHSLSSLEESISAEAAAVVEHLPMKAYLGASAHTGEANPFKRAFASLEGRRDWFSVQISGGHLLHVERPVALAYWTAQFLRMVAGKGF